MSTELLKLMALCLIAVVFSLVLKSKSSEYSFLIILVTGVVVMTVIIKNIVTPIKIITEKIADYGIETEYFKVALKAVGMAYITDFIADACRDAGQTSIATKAEIAGKAAIFVLSVPLLMSVLETAVGFLK